MKIEKITDNQLKITFDSIELEENNISVHSFLSHSLETQKMYLAILEIAYEDLGFDTKNSTRGATRAVAPPATKYQISLTPPVMVIPIKINTKIRVTPASPESTRFKTAKMPRWITMWITEGIEEIRFW